MIMLLLMQLQRKVPVVVLLSYFERPDEDRRGERVRWAKITTLCTLRKIISTPFLCVSRHN